MRLKVVFVGLAGYVGVALGGGPQIAVAPEKAHAQQQQEQQPPPPVRVLPLACYTAAQDRTLLSKSDADRLCSGAANVVPVDCFVAADDQFLLSDIYKIALCQCARSLEPVACFERAEDETDLSDPQAVDMCNARKLWRLRYDCRPL